MGETSRPKATAAIRPSTRDALVAGARAILAERGPSAPISDIADRAGVAVGSFYNHFESKDALFREAAQSALTEWEDYMIQRTAGISDPQERICSRIRLMGRMCDIEPDTARIVVNAGPQLLAMPRGYSPRAEPDITEAVGGGRLKPGQDDLKLMVVVAAGEKFLALRMQDPSIPPERADDLAETLMVFLGTEPQRARQLAHMPLPPDA